jgi:hydrogenase maturation protease
MTMLAQHPFVVGYGNALRGDDAVGWYVAELVAGDPRFADIDVLSVRQLTPDLAEEFAHASRVVLVDAAADGERPGTVHVTAVDGGPETSAAFSHHVDAWTLVALTEALYGDAPPTAVVTVSLASTGFGMPLSHAVVAAIPDVVETVARLSLEPFDA